MEIGTDVTELFTNLEHRDIDIEYKDKIWQFTIRDLTWTEKNNIISQSAGISGKKGSSKATFDVNKYNQMYLEKCVVKAPFEINKMNIFKLNEEFGDLLISTLVDKAEQIEEEEEGN
jgi:hypothetical protein